MLQGNCSLAVIVTLRVHPLPEARAERAKWSVEGGADALFLARHWWALLEQTVKVLCHSLFTWMAKKDYAENVVAQRATRIEDGWEHLIRSPLHDFPSKVG